MLQGGEGVLLGRGLPFLFSFFSPSDTDSGLEFLMLADVLSRSHVEINRDDAGRSGLGISLL